MNINPDWQVIQKIASQRYEKNLWAHVDWAIQFLEQHRLNDKILAQELDNLFLLIEQMQKRDHFHKDMVRLMRLMGNLPFRMGYWTKWESCLEFAINVMDTLYYIEDKIQLMNELAEIYYYTGRHEKNRGISEVMIRLGTILNSATTMVKGATRLIDEALYQNNLDEAQLILQKTIETTVYQNAKGDDAQKSRALITFNQGVLLRYEGKFIESISKFDEGIALIAEKSAHETAFAELLRLRGLTHWYASNPKQALQDIRKSAAIYEHLNDVFSTSLAKGNLGLVYWTTGKLMSAQTAFQEALELSDRYRATQQKIGLLGNMGLVYLSRGWINRAQDMFNQQITLAERFDIPYEYWRGMSNRAVTYIYAQRYEEAERDLLLVYESILPTGRKIHIGIVLVNIGWLYYRMGCLELANEYAHQSQDILQDVHSSGLYILINRFLAVCKPSQALTHLKQALHLSKTQKRMLDYGACLLQLAYLEQNMTMWQKARRILNECGAQSWLIGVNPINDLLLPFLT